jgi:hypothetical protein
MLRMVAERLEDRALLRLIKTWRKAGVLDTDGQSLPWTRSRVRPPVTGTPHGGIISPMLANVSRHDAVDLWFERVVTPPWRGEACLLRDADDFVCACERQPEAERFYTMPGQRRGTFGRELSAEKTRVMPFSRHPPAPKTRVELLGFECRWDKDRAGKDPGTRRTARKKLRTSLKRFERTRNEFRLKVAREKIFRVQGILRPW